MASPITDMSAWATNRGARRAASTSCADGEGALSLWGPNDKINVDISASGDDPNVGYVGVADDRGQIQAAMSVFSSGEGGITTWGPNDKVNVDISSDASSPNPRLRRRGRQQRGGPRGALCQWRRQGNRFRRLQVLCCRSPQEG